jgi:hypothetical protein
MNGYFSPYFPQKNSFRASNDFGCSGPEKLLKIVNCAKTERLNGGGPNGIGGWPHISTWIIPPPLGSNGLHCVEFLHEMRKLLLNLVPGEGVRLP